MQESDNIIIGYKSTVRYNIHNVPLRRNHQAILSHIIYFYIILPIYNKYGT